MAGRQSVQFPLLGYILKTSGHACIHIQTANPPPTNDLGLIKHSKLATSTKSHCNQSINQHTQINVPTLNVKHYNGCMASVSRVIRVNENII